MNRAPWWGKREWPEPYGMCQCGCGQQTLVQDRTQTRHGYLKGEPSIYLRGHNLAASTFHDALMRHVDVGAQNECWDFESTNGRGYGQFKYAGKNYRAHRVMYQITRGRLLKQSEVVMHTCDNPACVNPAHLRAGTQADNIADMDAKGRRQDGSAISGENSKRAVLTDEQVAEVRRLYATGDYTQVGLGRMFNTTKYNIWDIVHERTRN